MLTLEEKNKLEEIVENDEILKRVVKHIESYSNIDQLYYLYRTEVIEEEYQRDRVRYAAEDAKKEGQQEGLEKGQAIIIGKLLESGISEEEIVRITDIPLEKIIAIKNTLN